MTKSMKDRKAKIVCTIGPATSSEAVIRDLIQAGMNVARLNFSHGTHDSHRNVIRTIRRQAAELDLPVAILQDLAGPKVRVGEFDDGGVDLEQGQEFVLTTQKVRGDSSTVSVNYGGLPEEVQPGDRLLLNDGWIEMQVEEVHGPNIHCRVTIGGRLNSRKGVNCPSGLPGLPILSSKDLDDLSFGLSEGVDYVGLSFVRSSDDVRTARREIESRECSTPLIAKIETQAAVENIDDILREADGVMIARGDLSIETPFTRVPVLQKRIIGSANRLAKPVITATQMLWSMVNSPRPTRAEVADVANAVMDGTDAVMLSEETAVGNFPVAAVETMDAIVRDAESSGLQFGWEEIEPSREETPSRCQKEHLAETGCRLAGRLRVDEITTITRSGQMARFAAKYRPVQPILAVTPVEATFRQLALVRGVIPLLLPENPEEWDSLMRGAMSLVSESGWSGCRSVFVSEETVRAGTVQ